MITIDYFGYIHTLTQKVGTPPFQLCRDFCLKPAVVEEVGDLPGCAGVSSRNGFLAASSPVYRGKIMLATDETPLRELDGVPIQEVILHPNEVVLWSHPAKRMSIRGPSGLLVVTNERLLFTPDSRWMRGVNDVVWETELNRIASIYRTNFEGNLLFGSLAAGLGLVFSAAAKTGYTEAVKLMQCACVELTTGESEYFLNMKGFVTIPTAAVADELVTELSNAVATARSGGVSPPPEAIPDRENLS